MTTNTEAVKTKDAIAVGEGNANVTTNGSGGSSAPSTDVKQSVTQEGSTSPKTVIEPEPPHEQLIPYERFKQVNEERQQLKSSFESTQKELEELRQIVEDQQTYNPAQPQPVPTQTATPADPRQQRIAALSEKIDNGEGTSADIRELSRLESEITSQTTVNNQLSIRDQQTKQQKEDDLTLSQLYTDIPEVNDPNSEIHNSLKRKILLRDPNIVNPDGSINIKNLSTLAYREQTIRLRQQSANTLENINRQNQANSAQLNSSAIHNNEIITLTADQIRIAEGAGIKRFHTVNGRQEETPDFIRYKQNVALQQRGQL